MFHSSTVESLATHQVPHIDDDHSCRSTTMVRPWHRRYPRALSGEQRFFPSGEGRWGDERTNWNHDQRKSHHEDLDENHFRHKSEWTDLILIPRKEFVLSTKCSVSLLHL